MKTTQQHIQQMNSTKGLKAVFRWAVAVPLMAAALSCSTQSKLPPSVNASASPATISETRLTYDQYIAQGQNSLKAGETTQAINEFKQALREAGSEKAKQQEAYGHLGVAYVANADNPTAQAYLEKAGAKEEAPAWVKEEYKHLLSSQKFMTAEYMEKKLEAEQQIEKEQAEWLSANENTPSEDSGYKRRGFIVGKPMATTAMIEKEDYRPTHPVAIKPTQKVTKPPRHSGPAPVAGVRRDGPSAETSLDVHINFAFKSATLTAEGEKQADELGKLLQEKLQDGNQIAVLVGHTDIIGGEEFNDHLSEIRAAAVKSYLIGKFPELKGKLSERGMGKRQPLYKEMDEESQSLNRRVEVKLSRTSD